MWCEYFYLFFFLQKIYLLHRGRITLLLKRFQILVFFHNASWLMWKGIQPSKTRSSTHRWMAIFPPVVALNKCHQRFGRLPWSKHPTMMMMGFIFEKLFSLFFFRPDTKVNNTLKDCQSSTSPPICISNMYVTTAK